MGITSLYKLPWPEGPETADGPDGYQDLAVAIDAAIVKQTTELITTSYYASPTNKPVAKAGAWATGAKIGPVTAPAGKYLVSGVLYWDVVANLTTHTWLAIQINGSNTMARSCVGTFDQTDAKRTATPAYMQYSHQHAGGSLSVAIMFGFGYYDITSYPHTSIFVQRIGP